MIPIRIIIFAETRAGFRVPQNNYRAFFIPVNESFEPLFFYSSLQPSASFSKDFHRITYAAVALVEVVLEAV